MSKFSGERFVSYKEHPLLKVSEQPPESGLSSDSINLAIAGDLDASRHFKRKIGAFLYPFKNQLERFQLERKLSVLAAKNNTSRPPDVICGGQKGFSNDIFLRQISGF
jgi:hypothetical protein